MSLQKSILLLICCLIFPVRSAEAWPTNIRGDIVTTAFELLPVELRQILEPYRNQILSATQQETAATLNNDWNVHDEESGLAADRITALFSDLTRAVTSEISDINLFATNLGELAALLAEINYPLNTDNYASEEDIIRTNYDADIAQLLSVDCGLELSARFWAKPLEQGRSAVQRANRFYPQVIEAYTQGAGYNEVARITEFCARNAVQDIFDTWSTLWAQANAQDQHILSISTDRHSYARGDTLNIFLSTVAARTERSLSVDLYIAFFLKDELTYISTLGEFSSQPTPFKQNWYLPEVSHETILSVVVPDNIDALDLDLYAVLVEPGGRPEFISTWLSNLSYTGIQLYYRSDFDLNQLSDETYLFHALTADGTTSAIPIRRWDLIFTGDYQDDPLTIEDESWSNRLIPGEFNHLMVYLGRDENADPWGMEMTTSLTTYGQGFDLRIIRFPEFGSSFLDKETITLAIGPKNLSVYHSRWAMRLNDEQRAALQEHETQLFMQMEEDWSQGFPYQLEFNWSGTITDKTIQLIDDGRENGASCTDYWLSLFEDYAGVCIEGTRMNSAEFEDYFRTDPEGVLVTIPESFNPFPFSITIAQALNLGFTAVDPAAHSFSCDGSSETGVPIPTRLRYNSALTEITPVATPAEW
jgi:hypothetical protein